MSRIFEKQQRAKQEAAQEAIYEAAVDVISRTDFEGLRMQDVASEVGIATGTLYNYFKNKVELLYYVNYRLHETVLEIVEEISGGEDAADKRLQELVDAVFHFVEKYHVVFDLAERSGVKDRTPAEDKQAFLETIEGCLEKILQDGIDEGRFRSVDVRRTAMVLFEAMIGICERHKYLGNYDFSESKRDLLGMFMDYLRAA